LECAKRWGGICVAAHVAADHGGLLKKLSGQSRTNVWTSPDLLACALAGPIEEAPEALRPILANKAGDYHRGRPVAVINASDINGPEDLKREGSSCFIKMSTVSVEAKIKNGLSKLKIDQCGRVSASKRSQDGLLWNNPRLIGTVEVCGDRIATPKTGIATCLQTAGLRYSSRGSSVFFLNLFLNACRRFHNGASHTLKRMYSQLDVSVNPYMM
jgi:hypothetical protein